MTEEVNFKQSVELEDLAQLAVHAQSELVAAGELQVGQTAQIVAHGAVNAGAYVILEVLPQPGRLAFASSLPSSSRKMSLTAIITDR